MREKEEFFNGTGGEDESAGPWHCMLLYDYIHQLARNRDDPDDLGALYGLGDPFILHGHALHVRL